MLGWLGGGGAISKNNFPFVRGIVGANWNWHVRDVISVRSQERVGNG